MASRKKISRAPRSAEISIVSKRITKYWQEDNEKALKALADDCKDGVFANIAEAIDELDTPRIKGVKPYKTYDGALTLGDPETFPAAMSINVERYFKTHLARP